MRKKHNNTLATLTALASLGLATSANAVIVSFVDFQQVESGATLAAQAGADIQLAPDTTGTTFLVFTSGSLNFTFTAGGGGSLVGRGADNDRTNVLPNLTQPDLHADLWAARGGNGEVSVSIDGFNLGDVVTFTVWHNDSFGPNPGFGGGQVIDPSLTSGGTLGATTSGEATNLDGSATVEDSDLFPTTITFTSDGNAAEILLTAFAAEFLPMSGFTVDVVPVPEPSSTALLGLGGVAFMLRRRR